MQANLPMGANKVTGMADPAVATDGATKNYVDTTTAAFFSTGDVKLTIKTVADSGWLIFDDGTFGSASSGSSNSNSIANLALFTLFFNNISDTAAPLLTSGGGATTRAAQVSASAAWAANCRMSLLKTLGRALGVAGSGSGLTARPLGSIVGNETAVIGTPNLPPYTPAGSVPLANVGTNMLRTTNAGVADNPFGGGGATIRRADDSITNAPTASFSGTAQGGISTPLSIMQPEVFLNAMIKV